MVTRNGMEWNVGFFFVCLFLRLIKTSFRRACESQMYSFANGCKYLNLSKFPQKSLEWLKSRLVLYSVPVFSL